MAGRPPAPAKAWWRHLRRVGRLRRVFIHFADRAASKGAPPLTTGAYEGTGAKSDLSRHCDFELR